MPKSDLEINRDEHNADLLAKKVQLVSPTTIYAVVNTSAAGNTTVEQGTSPWLTSFVGNVTLSDAKTYIGLTTATLGASSAFIGITTVANKDRTITGNLTLSDPKGYIGLVSVAQPLSATFSGNITLDDGSLTGIVGNVTLSDSKTYVGLVTATVGNNPVLGAGVNNIGFASVTPVMAWPDPKTYIGLVTITGSLAAASGNITLDDGSLTGIIGNVTVEQGDNPWVSSLLGNVTLSDAKTFIGLTTTTLGASPAFVGIVTIANSNARTILGNLTLSDAKSFIGLTTTVVGNVASSLTTVVNTGSGKTWKTSPIALNATNLSGATLFVGSANVKYYITQLTLSASATVGVTFMSGVTYLSGNASIRHTVAPMSGLIKDGSVLGPVHFGLANQQSFSVVTDNNATIVGDVVYYEE